MNPVSSPQAGGTVSPPPLEVPPALTRAANGAVFLDEHMPGWRGLVDKDRLDMANPCMCVLGQLFDAGEFSGYVNGLQHFRMRTQQAIRLGFYDQPNSDYTELQEAWEALL